MQCKLGLGWKFVLFAFGGNQQWWFMRKWNERRTKRRQLLVSLIMYVGPNVSHDALRTVWPPDLTVALWAYDPGHPVLQRPVLLTLVPFLVPRALISVFCFFSLVMLHALA